MAPPPVLASERALPPDLRALQLEWREQRRKQEADIKENLKRVYALLDVIALEQERWGGG